MFSIFVSAFFYFQYSNLLASSSISKKSLSNLSAPRLQQVLKSGALTFAAVAHVETTHLNSCNQGFGHSHLLLTCAMGKGVMLPKLPCESLKPCWFFCELQELTTQFLSPLLSLPFFVAIGPIDCLRSGWLCKHVKRRGTYLVEWKHTLNTTLNIFKLCQPELPEDSVWVQRHTRGIARKPTAPLPAPLISSFHRAPMMSGPSFLNSAKPALRRSAASTHFAGGKLA